MIYMFLSNNPSSRDINSSNLSCFFRCRMKIVVAMVTEIVKMLQKHVSQDDSIIIQASLMKRCM